MTDPLISGECAALAALTVALGFTALAAIVGLVIHVRNAVLGARLLRACGGDWPTAVVAIANVRAENAALEVAIRRGFHNQDNTP